MRYFKHLALWTVTGLCGVALAGALAAAIVGGGAALLLGGLAAASFGAFVGAILGGYSGAICGAVTFLVLAFARPPLRERSAPRLNLALRIVCGFVALGTPVLSVGTALIYIAVKRAFPLLMHASSRTLDDAVMLVESAHFPLIALPALLSLFVASRAIKRFETRAAHASSGSGA